MFWPVGCAFWSFYPRPSMYSYNVTVFGYGSSGFGVPQGAPRSGILTKVSSNMRGILRGVTLPVLFLAA